MNTLLRFWEVPFPDFFRGLESFFDLLRSSAGGACGSLGQVPGKLFGSSSGLPTL